MLMSGETSVETWKAVRGAAPGGCVAQIAPCVIAVAFNHVSEGIRHRRPAPEMVFVNIAYGVGSALFYNHSKHAVRA